MNIDIQYVSSACNSSVGVCDWGSNNLICFGSCNSVIIFNPKYPGTNKDLRILTGHSDKVSVAKWIKFEDGRNENEIISTSNDCSAIVWTLKDNQVYSTILKGHSEGVNRADALYLDQSTKSLLVATASIDSTVKIWIRSSNTEFSNIQTIDFNRGLCVGLCLAYVPNTDNILMACGRDTSKIDLYVRNDKNFDSQFNFSESLKGHENWVPGLHFTSDEKGDLLLASSSQDKFIRVWRISKEEIRDEDDENEFIKIVNALKTKFFINDGEERKRYIITLESVICGHEGWVYDVKWSPKIKKDGKMIQPMKLLSCSLDKTMIIWAFDETAKLWMDATRVGEVGGNTLGFYGCCFSPDAMSILGHGYLGSFHLWNYSKENSSWKPAISPGGHSGSVVDLSWDPDGMYIMSVGQDQTTRIHAPWVRDKSVSWHEIARPQVHGYDMSCLAILSRYKFVSGAEEKIVRVFESPLNFVENFHSLCGITEDSDSDFINELKQGPKGASVPSLGLSNKAVYESSNEDEVKPTGKEYYPEESYFHEVHMKEPPTEENLIQNTLWPEAQKLYGHGYEIFAVASSHDGKLVASSCRATNPQHASIILWDAEKWEQKQILASHTLTVTQISFSPDDNKILSVSRDRRLSIFEKNSETNEYILAATTDKKTCIHARIIWCCAWSHDSKYFITGSRDGKVVIWTKNLNKIDVNGPLMQYEPIGAIKEYKSQSVTAADFAPCLVNESYLICLGFESGEMKILKWNVENNWQECIDLEQSLAHHQAVKRIKFRPTLGEAGVKTNENVLQIASCGADNFVMLHNLYL